MSFVKGEGGRSMRAKFFLLRQRPSPNLSGAELYWRRDTWSGEPGWGVLDTSSGVPQAPFSASVLFPEAAVNPVTPPDSCLALKR